MQWTASRIASIVVVALYLVLAVKWESVAWAGKLVIYLILPFAGIWFPQKSVDHLRIFASLEDMFDGRGSKAMVIVGWVLLALPAVLYVFLKLPSDGA